MEDSVARWTIQPTYINNIQTKVIQPGKTLLGLCSNDAGNTGVYRPLYILCDFWVYAPSSIHLSYGGEGKDSHYRK